MRKRRRLDTIDFEMPGQAVENPPDPSLPPRAFCRGCGYALIGLESRQCPECGRGFDPANPRSFVNRPPRPWIWRWGRRVVGVMLLVAIAGGIGVEWLRRGWQSEQVAVAQMRKINAKITFKPIGPQSLGWVLGSRWGYLRDRVQGIRIDYIQRETVENLDWKGLQHVETFKCYFCNLTDGALGRIGEMRNVNELVLNCASIDDAGFAALERMPALTRLDLRGESLLKEELSHLSNLKRLRVLNVDATYLSDASGQYLRGLSSLEELDLSNCYITNEGLAQLSGLHSLRVLKLAYTRVTSSGIDKLKQAIPGLVVHQNKPGPQP